jgi:hypothetical protein
MNELVIYYEHEVETLRARVRQQNADILCLTQQLTVRYQLYSELEEELNRLKNEYETFKAECIHRHQPADNEPSYFELEPRTEL